MSYRKPVSRAFAALAIAALLALPASTVFAAKKVEKGAEDTLNRTLELMQGINDPIAAKLVAWLFATETRLPVDPHDMIYFARHNPDWPRMHAFREKIEKNLAGAAAQQQILDWFKDNPPEHFEGIKLYLDTLVGMGARTMAQQELSKFWKDAELDKNETAALAGSYSRLFLPTDHFTRIDNLIWEGRFSEAEYMLPFVDAGTRALCKARMALAQQSPTADGVLAQVPQQLLNNEGLLFERMKYRRRKDNDAGALEILNMARKIQNRPEKWWQEINILARREIEDGNPKQAYHLVAQHQMKEGREYAQAEWLLGWIELQYLHQPTNAYARFDKLYRTVQSAISKSRAAYWAAQAAYALKNQPVAAQWEKVAAMYPSTFYGQMEYVRVYGVPSGSFAPTAIAPQTKKAFDARETVRAVRLLSKYKLPQFIDPFLARMLTDAKTDSDYILTAKLAKEVGRNYYAVDANKQMQQKLGGFMMEEGYPLLSLLPAMDTERALVHAIIHRESMFDPKAASTAGARGLMQLMPATAKQMAAKKGRTYSLEKLTDDPQFNIALGSTYLGQLLDRYDGFYPLAIAAYNAGPGNVEKWIDQFGDPRDGHIDVINWIELIPIYETRNYVQRVMESYFMYRLRFNERPRTVLDFKRKS